MEGLLAGAECQEDDSTVFTDTVDGTFSLPTYCIKVIDTPPFQRLRGLWALGVTKFVFPGAVHTRFEHSLGVAYKAHKVARHIWKRQGGERAAHAEGLGVDMEEHDVKLVTLAGLAHDLGHGPLSHPFDSFVERMGVRDWKHEHMSARILEHLVENYDVGVSSSDVPRITDLIYGVPGEQQQGAAAAAGGGGLWRPGRRFLFDIVANKRNGVDVDKVDYLQRDAFMCGVRVGCDFDRLLKKKFIKVIDDEVCYPWSEYGNILDLFRAREAMHRKVYTNRRNKAVELMAVDALVAAEPLLRIRERLQAPQDYLSLDDSLLTTIEHYRINYRRQLDDAEERALTAAQGIVRRLRTRQLYRFGNQMTVPPEYLADSRWESMKSRFTAAEVAACYSGSDLPGGLRPEDIICDENKIDHTRGGANPAERVGFFARHDSRDKFYISQHQVVGIMPHFYQERVLRVFTPHQDERYVRAIEQALSGWCGRHFGGGVQLATPVRPGRQGEGPAAGIPQHVLAREALVREAASSLRQGGAPSQPAPGRAAAAAVQGTSSSATAAAASATAAAAGARGGTTGVGAARAGSSGSLASTLGAASAVEVTPPRAGRLPGPGAGAGGGLAPPPCGLGEGRRGENGNAGAGGMERCEGRAADRAEPEQNRSKRPRRGAASAVLPG